MSMRILNSLICVLRNLSLWKLHIAAFGVVLAISNGGVLAQQYSPCGNPFENHFGPWDYRTAEKNNLYAVESFHFTPDVQQMKRGQTSMNLAADIAYTLRVFPNHHIALKTMADWSIKSKSNPPAGAGSTVECWFDRGLRFRPDDEMVKLLFGIYLLKIGKTDDAIKYFEEAKQIGGNNANLHYNLGLAYVKLKRYDDALESAHIAYRLGFPLPGLRMQLERVGKWRD